MANSFPPAPGNWALASVAYSAVLPAPTLQPGSALDFGAGVGGHLVYSVPVLGIVFTFDVPGTFGVYDQATVEADLKQAVTGVCQVLAGMSGVALATLQGQVSVTRQWTWASGGVTATTSDAMAYP